MDKLFAGARLRRLREERGLSQVELARMLAISPSYLNQIEHDSRPVTATVLVRLSEVLGVDPSVLAPQDTARRVAELREALPRDAAGGVLAAADLHQVVESMPEVAGAVIDLYRRHREATTMLEAWGDARGHAPAGLPHDRVRDFFAANQNYFDPVDRAAEELAASIGTRRGEVRRRLRAHLERQHDIRVMADAGPGAGPTAVFDPGSRTLTLAADLRPGQQAFRMATQLAYVAAAEPIDAVLASVVWPDEVTRGLARIALAHHFAGAFVLPYGPFFRAARRMRCDVEALADHFGVGYEMTAHRLSTLQRPGMRGVPFIFVRVDKAGNISKRQSATGFHFSRGGGTCPLWNVYDAFAMPGTVNVQVAEMPDGQRYLWVARTVTRRRGGFGSATRTFVIGLGCELRQASRVVYSAGLDVSAPSPTLIGPGCRTCERSQCPQRSAPQLGASLLVDEHVTGFVPYPVRREASPGVGGV